MIKYTIRYCVFNVQ